MPSAVQTQDHAKNCWPIEYWV